MDEGARDAARTRAVAPGRVRPLRRPRLGRDLALIGLAVALALGALGAGAVFAYRALYGPSAFVHQYLGLLAAGNAADALAVPGVAVDSSALEEAGLPADASDVLLRRAVLTALSDVRTVEERDEDGVTLVTVAYRFGTREGSTTFAVEQTGWIGVAPAWRFAESPLAAVSLVVRGSQTFEVNGFALDRRQVAPLGVDAPALEPVTMLVFSPGLYRVSVDDVLASTPGVDVLADAPLTDTPVDLQAEPTAEFVAAVAEEVGRFLDACAEQQVLNPTGCPFGFTVRNRIVSPPVWTIVEYPEISLVPSGAEWAIAETTAVAHIDVDVRSLYDGSVTQVSEDVLFAIDAQIAVSGDGTASIRVSATTDPQV